MDLYFLSDDCSTPPPSLINVPPYTPIAEPEKDLCTSFIFRLHLFCSVSYVLCLSSCKHTHVCSQFFQTYFLLLFPHLEIVGFIMILLLSNLYFLFQIHN